MCPLEPFMCVVENLISVLAGCFELRPSQSRVDSGVTRDYWDLFRLAQETTFTVDEVEALYELFTKLGNSLINDGLIHKEELQLALFQTPPAENLLLDRVFDLFDENKNGFIEFEEFVRTLSVFHPYTPSEAKIDFAFQLYNLRQTGYIEREDVKRLVSAMLTESQMKLSDELLNSIIDKPELFLQTFLDADVDRDGRICKLEWKAFVAKHPSILRNMTLHSFPNAL